jgi:hypothetical protein
MADAAAALLNFNMAYIDSFNDAVDDDPLT